MSQDLSFANLMVQLGQGDEQAARRVFGTYAHRLIGLARNQLDTLIRQRVDPEDVVQSVFKSFFLGQAEGRWDLQNWDSLWSLLTVITVRKCGHQREQAHAACRDVQRQVHWQAADEGRAVWEPVARDPTPEAAALLAETVQQLLGGFEERERPIVVLILQGEDVAPIARQVGCSESKVYRVLRRVRIELERLRDAPAV